MCEFCHSHGDGKKWYLKAENYSEELGCGVCRSACEMQAIRLAPPNDHPVAQNLW